MSAPRECPSWCSDPGEIARLLRWLDENDLIEVTISDICYLLEKPWKWDKEYREMVAEQRTAAHGELDRLE